MVEHDLAVWQHDLHKRHAARERDPRQTIDEQAYAAALSMRWKHADHPHRSRKEKPTCSAVGFLLDPDTEQYLLKLTAAHIDDLRRRKDQGDRVLSRACLRVRQPGTDRGRV